MIEIFLTGWIILVGAIIINVVAKKIGLATWYDFLEKKKVKWYEYFFLFVIYPLLLGLFASLIL